AALAERDREAARRPVARAQARHGYVRIRPRRSRGRVVQIVKFEGEQEDMLRKLAKTVLAAAALMGSAGSARATTIIKIGTLAPGDSPWGKEFKRWANEVNKDT